MIIKLPVIIREWDEKAEKLITKKEDFPVEIDTSFKAHLKWEEHFSKPLGIDLSTYTERVQKLLKNKKKAKAEILSLLKLLYCYVNSPKLPTFAEFCGMFDVENADEILKKIATVLEEIGKSVSKNL